MNDISRENSVLTNKPTLETLFSLEKFPTYVGCVTTKQSEDIDLASLDQVYLFPHNDAIGLTWKNIIKNF
jgi:hypothetical protein